ncbi:hypothetical protein DPMN_071410 [Dreissena polymorpha]|uniref:Right handed beta helix domain-containing protein n=1 Tax=Dreissena polymorpha TaxID=45954 RepID=A0A9D4BW95_DREPO|nr:hypothetical protein DPMN_071410 [Dreissena polymorpha]
MTHLLVNNTKEGITLKTTKATLHDVTSTFSRTSGFHIIATDNKHDVSSISVSNMNASNNADGVTINAGTGYNNYISISNCIVADNTADGIVTTSTGNVTISECTIERNKARGMKLDMRTNGFIKIVKSLIRDNSEYALEGEVTAGIEMDSSTISDHRLVYYNWGWYTRAHTNLRITASNSKLTTVVIKNSIITNNTADGILLTHSYNNGGPVAITVDNNTFNIGNWAFEFDYQEYYLAPFYNNIIFVNNTMSNYTEYHRQKAVVKFRLTTYDNHNMISINQNRFANNTGYYGIRIEDVYGKAYVNISFNTFVSNSFSSSTIDIPYATKLDLHNNVFESLANPSCALQAPGFEISYSINATNNYWGSKNLSEIVNTICGFEKNMGHSYVSYIPYYEDKMLTQLTSPENFNKSIAHGTFGGELTRNTQLARSDFPMPILIQRSIVIRYVYSVSFLHLTAIFGLQRLS